MHPAIDYDRLLVAYRASLGARLRGFRASDDAPEFLETWVPGEDDEESIAALLDAAASSGLDATRIRFGEETLARRSRDDLVRIAARHGDVGVEPGDGALEVTVRLSAGTAAASSGHRANVAKPERAPAERGFTRDAAAAEAYDAALAKIEVTHEGALNADAVSVVTDGMTFAVEVEAGTDIVTRACHSGAEGAQRAVLELLAREAEGAPIWDLAEHAVIRVEHSLRGRGGRRAVPGIVTPDNADPRLRIGAEMMRALGRAYQEKTGASPPLRNEWDPPPSSEWRALSPEARIARIQQKLDAVAPAKASCLRVDKDSKVIVALARDVDPKDKPALLMQIERSLRDDVERTLGVWLEEVTDLNRIRRLAKDEAR